MPYNDDLPPTRTDDGLALVSPVPVALPFHDDAEAQRFARWNERNSPPLAALPRWANQEGTPRLLAPPMKEHSAPCGVVRFARACWGLVCECARWVTLPLIVAAALPWIVVWYAVQGGEWLWRKGRRR